MAIQLQRLDTSGFQGALGQLGQVNAQRAAERRAKKQRMMATVGALAGAGLGVGLAPMLGVGALSAAGAGAGVGSSVFSGNPVGAATGLLGLGGMAEQAQAKTQQQAQQESIAKELEGMGTQAPIEQVPGSQLQPGLADPNASFDEIAGGALQGALGPAAQQPSVAGQYQQGALSPQQERENKMYGLLGGLARSGQTGPAVTGALGMMPKAPKYGHINVPGVGLVQTNQATGAAVPTGLGDGAAAQTPPSGYRPTADGRSLEFIPGGPADPGIKPKEDPYFAGKGLGIADSRNLSVIGPKVLDGTATDADLNAYTLSWQRASRPEVQSIVDENGRASTIQRPALQLPANRFPPPPGIQPQGAMGGAGQGGGGQGARGQGGAAGIAGATTVGTKKQPVPAETAGKLASLQVARSEVALARAAFIREDGTVDQSMVLSAWIGAPKTQGREVKQRMQRSLEAKLRADSGAAVPPSEVERYLTMYLPSPADGDEGVKNKMDSFQAYIDGAIGLATFGRGIVSEDLLKKVQAKQAREQGGNAGLQQLRQRFTLQPVN